jgi:beta-lactamase regulating signal transducer with metallopeptidase domain
MSAVQTLLTGPLVQAIGWALLHLLWQGVLVAAILAAALALLQRQSANARYLASCGALLLLVALGIATAYRAYDPGVAPAMPAAVTTYIMDGAAPGSTPEPDSVATAATATTWQDAVVWAVSFANAHLAQIVAIWLAGVLILSTRLIVGWIGAHRLTTRRSHAAGDQWKRSLHRIAEALQLRRSITLLESAAVEVPTVIGWLRPVVLLPVASLSGLSMQQIEMILAHELAHIRRHDFIVNLMQSVVETLLFYHPAVWWISRRIRLEREHCCDDLAVAVFGDALQYARALTRFEELRMESQSVLAANGGSLIARIRRLVAARAESANWSSRWAAGAALLTVVAAILIAPALPLFANRDEQTPKPSPTPAADECAGKNKDSKVKCADKEKQAHATVEVEATDQSSDDEADNNADPNSDDSSDAPAVVAVPVVAPHVVVSPMVAVAPMVDVSKTVATAVEASTAAIAQLMADGTEERRPLRRRIGEGGKLSVDDLITLHNAGVDPKYIEEMRGAGIGDLTLDDLVSLRIQGVNPTYIKEMSAAGYPNLTARQLIALRVQGVSSKYVQELSSAGYKNLSINDLVSMRVQGVDAPFVKSLAEAGYGNLTAKELIRLRASGVDANFIRELSKYRTK